MNEHAQNPADEAVAPNGAKPHDPDLPGEAPEDVAERPGTSEADHQHADELADEWGEESFPGSDPPAHY